MAEQEAQEWRSEYISETGYWWLLRPLSDHPEKQIEFARCETKEDADRILADHNEVRELRAELERLETSAGMQDYLNRVTAKVEEKYKAQLPPIPGSAAAPSTIARASSTYQQEDDATIADLRAQLQCLENEKARAGLFPSDSASDLVRHHRSQFEAGMGAQKRTIEILKAQLQAAEAERGRLAEQDEHHNQLAAEYFSNWQIALTNLDRWQASATATASLLQQAREVLETHVYFTPEMGDDLCCCCERSVVEDHSPLCEIGLVLAAIDALGRKQEGNE